MQCIPAHLNNRRTVKKYAPCCISPPPRTSALRSNSEKRSTTKQPCRSASPVHPSNRRTAKTQAPYRTPPTPRTSAERGQENGQRDYRAPSVQRSNHLRSKGRRTLPASLHPKALFFFSTEHGALLFLRARRKRRGGCISNKRDVGAFPT